MLQIIVPEILGFAPNTYYYLHWKLSSCEDCIIKFLMYLHFQFELRKSNFMQNLGDVVPQLFFAKAI